MRYAALLLLAACSTDPPPSDAQSKDDVEKAFKEVDQSPPPGEQPK